jgi:hypothetical protein
MTMFTTSKITSATRSMGNFSLQNLFKDAMTGLKYKLSSATNFVSRILVAFCILLTGFVGARDPEPCEPRNPMKIKCMDLEQ